MSCQQHLSEVALCLLDGIVREMIDSYGPYASVLASRQVGVSNHWTRIQNGTVEWKMEWNAVIAHSMDNTAHMMLFNLR